MLYKSVWLYIVVHIYCKIVSRYQNLGDLNNADFSRLPVVVSSMLWRLTASGWSLVHHGIALTK